MSGLNSLSSKELEYFRQIDADHWQLNEPYIVDTSTVKKDWFAVYPSVNFEGQTLEAATTDFSFHINEGLNYIVPSDSYIQLQFTITKINAADVIAPTNPISHCLFRSCSYYINNNLIESNKDYNQWRGLVQGLMTYRKSFLDKAGQSLGWALDTPGTGDGIIKYDVQVGNNDYTADVQTFNSGLVARYQSRTANANFDTYNLRIPLSELFSFCKEIRTVYRKHQHRIDFSLNKNTNSFLHRNGSANRLASNITIKKMRLWLCFVKPSTETLAKLSKMFETYEVPRPIKYSPYRILWRRDNVANFSWQLPEMLHRPLHVYFFAVDPPKTTQNGTSPMVFQHRSIRNIRFTVGGIEHPYRGLECNFADGEEDYTRAYDMYLQCAGATYPDEQDVMISYKEFKNNYPIFCFDFSDLEEEYFSSNKNCFIHADMTAANTDFYCVIVYQQLAYLSMAEEGIRIYNKD